MPAGEIPIRGRHNVENVLAASIAAARAGVSHAAIAAAVRTFHAVEHRLEFVRKVSGIDFYNDSKATSVDATLKALDAFPGGLWVILGGKDKGLDYAAAARAARRRKRAPRVLIGAAAAKIAGQLDGAVPLVDAHTLDAAVAYAFASRRAGRYRTARAGLRQLRSIPQLRASRRGFQADGKRIANRRTDMAQQLKTDWILFATVVAMVAFGVLILYSASSIMADLNPRYRFELVLRRAPVGLGRGRGGRHDGAEADALPQLPDPAVAFGAIGMALILLVAVYFIDGEHHRWLRLAAPGGLQPSELAKPALVIFLAFFVTWRGAGHQ